MSNFPWMTDVTVKIITLTVMLVGLFGLAVPIVPGLVIIWLGALGYGLFTGFDLLGWIMFSLVTVLMIVGSLVDNILMGKKAYDSGAPWWVVLIALVAGFLGNFAMPIIGGILAALLALFLLEWARRRNWREALTSTKGMAQGCGWAFVIRFIMGLFMIGFWLIWAFA